jgi:hypothetical protein
LSILSLSLMDFLLNELKLPARIKERILLREIFTKTKDIRAFQKQDFSEILGRPLTGWKHSSGSGKIMPEPSKNYLDFSPGAVFGASVWGSHGLSPGPGVLRRRSLSSSFTAALLPPKENNAVGIVGTRKPTALGRRSCSEGRGTSWASGEGFTVVSGLAWGIDGEAHLGCLEAGACNPG